MRTGEELILWVVGRPFEKTGNGLLGELEPILHRLRVNCETDSEYPGLQKAEAMMVQDEAGATVCFASRTPTLSAVLEELAHVAQGRGTPAPEDDIFLVLYRREVEAKECLIENAETLGIPETETLETALQLTQYREALARREGLFQ